MINLPKSGSSSPTKHSKSVNQSMNFGTPSKSKSTVASPGPKVINITLVRSSTFGRESQKAQQIKDVAVFHESKVLRNMRLKEIYNTQPQPKRDPILQNNGEEVEYVKPRRLISQERPGQPISRDEVIVRQKKIGEFNEAFNPRSLEPKPQGIRAFKILPSECMDENVKRISKPVRSMSEGRFRNPITEGEEILYRRKRRSGIGNEELKKLNDKKYLLPFERGCSNHRRSLHESTITFDDSSFDLGRGNNWERQRSATPTNRTSKPLSTMQIKMRGIAKGILEYEDGPKFRKEKITEKVGTIKFTDILKANGYTGEYSRTKTLEF